MSEQSLSEDDARLETDERNPQIRQETVSSNNVLTLSKSCNKEISKARSIQKMHSALGGITPIGSQIREKETKNTISSRSSPRVCNENIKFLEDVYGATSPQNLLRAHKSGKETPTSHSGSAAVIGGRKLIKACSNPNSPL